MGLVGVVNKTLHHPEGIVLIDTSLLEIIQPEDTESLEPCIGHTWNLLRR